MASGRARVMRSLAEAPRAGSAELSLTIGNFDGFHLGHAAVASELVASARRRGTPALAVTFDPHPLSVLGTAERPFVLTPTEEKIELMGRAGVDALLVLEFTRALASTSAREFLATLGVGSGSHLVLGYDFRMGRGRETDLASLSALGELEGFGLDVVPPVVHEGAPVSSSRVREALWAGDAERAAAMLGRPYRLAGRVERGSGLGARLGFPTANLSLSAGKLLPGDGVYMAAVAGDAPAPGLLYVGVRPTLGGRERRAEVHIVDRPGVPYGKPIAVDVLRRLREDRAFASESDLARQIGRDLDEARRLGWPGA